MKLIGYAPDADQTTEGVLIDCVSFIPTEKGMQAAPSPQSAGASPLVAPCYGAALTRALDNTFRVFAGTVTNLYELSANVWIDRTRAVGGAYAVGVDNFWRFTQFGNATLAVAKTETLQSTSSGAFANVTGAPKASIVETVAGFVFLFDTNEASFGDSPNRWWCAAINSFTDWVPSIATQSATGLLVSAPGRIYAGKRFGDRIIVYKERAMYIGNYVGAPQIWNFQQIEGEAGCNSQEAVVNVGSSDNPTHIFMGADDFWRFDGARPVPIGGPIRKTVYADLDYAFANRIKTLHDRINSRVYFYYPSKGNGGNLNRCVVYHYRLNTWGRDDRPIQATLEYLSGGVTWDSMPFTTWDSINPNVAWDSPFWTSGNLSVGIFDNTNRLNSLDGAATTASFTLNDMGDDDKFYLLQRVKPRWLVKPAAATMTNYFKQSEGDTLNTGVTTAMSVSRFDVLISSRWHRLQFNTVGDCTVNEIEAVYQIDGAE